MAESWDAFPDAPVSESVENPTSGDDWGQFPDVAQQSVSPGVILGKMTQQMIDAPADSQLSGARRLPNRILYGVNRMPGFGKVLGAGYDVAVLGAANRIKDDKAGPIDYVMVANLLASKDEAAKQGTLQNVMDVVGHIPAFGVEFGLTGGAFSSGKALASKAIGSSVKSAVGRAAANAAGAATGVAAQAALNPQLVAQNTIQRMMPEMRPQVTDEGQFDNVAFNDGDSFLSALPKAYLDTAIELGSERSGGHIVGALAKLPGAARLAALKNGIVAHWLEKPGRTPGMLDDVLKQAGWNGVIGEVLEERAGDVARLATGLETPDQNVVGKLGSAAVEGATGDTEAAKKHAQEALTQLTVEGLAFMVPGAVNVAATRAFGQKPEQQPDTELAAKLDAIQQQYADEHILPSDLAEQRAIRDQNRQAAEESAWRMHEAGHRSTLQEADRLALDRYFHDRAPAEPPTVDDSAGVRQLPLSPETELPDPTLPPAEQQAAEKAPPQLQNPTSEIYDPNPNRQRWIDREAELQSLAMPQLSKQADAYGLPKSWNKSKVVEWIVSEEKRRAAEQPLTDTVSQQQAAMEQPKKRLFTKKGMTDATTAGEGERGGESTGAIEGTAPPENGAEVRPEEGAPDRRGDRLGQGQPAKEVVVPQEGAAGKRLGKKPAARDQKIRELAELDGWLANADTTEPDYDAKSIRAQLLESELKKTNPDQQGTTAATVASPGPIQVLGYGASPRQAKPRTPPPASAPAVQAILYGKGFIGADVVPTVKQAAATVAEAASQIQSAFAPQTRGGEARTMKGLAREHGAVLQRRRDVATKAFETASKFFTSRTTDENYDFINKMEHGESQANADLDTIAANIRQLLDARRGEVQALGTGKLEHFIQDYFPHIWEQPDQASQAFAAILGKRPLEGPKSFLKERTIDTFSEGIAAGLVPVSHNPVDLALLKAFEMDRYILGQRLLADMKTRGLATYVPAGTRAEDGLTKIDDKIATVYGAPTIPVSEHVNKSLWDALNAVAANLGVKHVRKPTVGGGALGKSFQGGNEVQTRANTDLSVLAHEISHQLDYKYDLQGQFLKGRSKPFHDQLRHLADMHESRKKYFRKRAEKMATLLESYVRLGPEGLHREAPDVSKALVDFLRKTVELKPLVDLRQTLANEKLITEVPHGGLLIRGQWYAPDAAANVINNYLSPGLRSKSAVFRVYLGMANVMNQFQLGWSAFHLGFTSMDAATSKLALAIEQTAAGKPLEAAKSAVLGATGAAAFTNAIRGDKLLKEWVTPGSQGAEIAKLVDGLVKAGGRVKQDEFYKTHMVENALEAFRAGNVVGGLLRLPFALTDAASKPIMEWIVPRQKLGVFADLAEAELEKLGPNATEEAVREAMAKAWDSADNRMGQVVYDNLFWNKAAKEVAMASVRSLGWNLGTFRELGGGATDWLKAGVDLTQLKKPELTHRMAYTIAMPALAGMIGGILHYLMTGEPPEETKDWFYPKTGKQDETGHDIRLSLPSYMKDVYAYAGHPLTTLGHKMHPAISATIEMLQNKDFYGTKIRNEDDPLVRQAIDVAEHTAGQFVPFAVRGQQQIAKGEGGIGESLLPFIGITPAPGSITHSAAEQLASELLRQKMPVGARTQEQATKAQAKAQAARHLAAGKLSKEEIVKEAEAAGVELSDDDWKAIDKRSKSSTLEYAIEHLDATESVKVWNAATENERETITSRVADKIAKSRNLSDADQSRLAKHVGKEAEAALRKEQLHEATTLAKHVLSQRPTSLTAKEKSEGRTIQQKRDEWKAQKDDAKKRLGDSTLDKNDILKSFKDSVLAEMKDPFSRGQKLQSLKREMGWQQ